MPSLTPHPSLPPQPPPLDSFFFVKVDEDEVDQFKELWNYMVQSGLKSNAIWIDATDSSTWGSIGKNIVILANLLAYAKRNSVPIGFVTGQAEWKQIFGILKVPASYPLWYLNEVDTTIDSCTGFMPFGGFKTPTLQRWGVQILNLCEVMVFSSRYC